ncbi:MAG: hypothetical protein CME70_06365 [Halobacteriovorax sp.]|nr:hypothetical protein [Halobacteriovorax sp.]MBK23614.1 hypothetical protein [Halobacteriovorax sp.]|tara:strand:- start:2341 stop:3537 length:1197 start_codon:yes stop_codon:yes gene_type:complete
MRNALGRKMKKKNVLIRAPLLSYSGYGTHSRQIFKWLLSRDDVEIYSHIVPWGITSWMINPDLEDGLMGDIMSSSRQLPPNETFDISFQVQLPNEWDSTLAQTNIGISAFVETDRCNPNWIQCCNNMDAVIVPSQHVKTCIYNTGQVTKPLFVIPESYYECLSNDDIKDLDLDFDTPFNFLVFGQLTGKNPDSDRKNLFYTVKWLCETFKDNPDVGIVIKTNSGRNTKIDRVVTTRVLSRLIEETRIGDYPKIHFLHGSMTQDEIASLYRHPKVKALVSLTRGEGYGLPLLEAAVSGMPIIATGWSGHLDFMGHGKFLDVKYNLQEIHSSRVDNNIFIPGARWAEPIEEDAKRRFQKFYKSPGTPTKWAESLSKKLKDMYSQEKINQLYSESLELLFK